VTDLAWYPKQDLGPVALAVSVGHTAAVY